MRLTVSTAPLLCDGGASHLCTTLAKGSPARQVRATNARERKCRAAATDWDFSSVLTR